MLRKLRSIKRKTKKNRLESHAKCLKIVMRSNEKLKRSKRMENCAMINDRSEHEHVLTNFAVAKTNKKIHTQNVLSRGKLLMKSFDGSKPQIILRKHKPNSCLQSIAFLTYRRMNFFVKFSQKPMLDEQAKVFESSHRLCFP